MDAKEKFPPVNDGDWIRIFIYDERFKQHAIIRYVQGARFLVGWGHDGEWADFYNTNSNLWTNGWEIMDGGEVYQLLIKEAEKRGYEEGTMIDSLTSRDRQIIELPLGKFNYTHYDPEQLHKNDTLFIGDIPIYTRGLWAEIVKGAGEMSEEDIAKEQEEKKEKNLRDHFAIALAPQVYAEAEESNSLGRIARRTYDMADALIKERRERDE